MTERTITIKDITTDFQTGITIEKIIETRPMTYDELLSEVQRQRQAEYPDFREYLDGVVKNDQEQMDKYIADCLAVKAKYPKPEGN